MSNNLNNQMMMTMMNESVNHTLVDGSNDVDLNEKYFLHIIVPILWSIIVLFGIIGKWNCFFFFFTFIWSNFIVLIVVKCVKIQATVLSFT